MNLFVQSLIIKESHESLAEKQRNTSLVSTLLWLFEKPLAQGFFNFGACDHAQIVCPGEVKICSVRLFEPAEQRGHF